MKQRVIVMGVLVLSMVAGAVVPAVNAQSIPPPRYQVIADIATMAGDITQLKRDVADLREQVAVLQLLRAHDIQLHDRERAADLMRVALLERQGCAR